MIDSSITAWISSAVCYAFCNDGTVMCHSVIGKVVNYYSLAELKC